MTGPGVRLSEAAEDGHALVVMVTGPEGGPYWRELRRFASEAAAAARDENVEALGEIRMRALAERRRLIERHGCPVQVVVC